MRIAIGGIRGIPASYGGFETAADETARRMSHLGHQVSVYCRSRENGNKEPKYAGIGLLYLATVPVNSLETLTHSIAVGLHVAFKGRDVDVVHMYNAASAFGGLIVRIAGKPLVITLDGLEWEREKWGKAARMIWRLSTWLAVRVASTAVCDSKTVKDLLDKKYDANIRFIPYGAKRLETTSRYFERLGLKRFNYFIFVGRLVPEKEVNVLLDGYASLVTDMPLVIVGDNENDQAYVSMLRRKAGRNVIFLGYQYGAEYESLLSNARAYVTASKLEGTSPSLLAAMGAQVCCLARSIPENQETGGESIVYFDGSVEDLAKKWRAIAEDDEFVGDYASRGYKRVTEHYDWDVVSKQYLEVYAAVCRAV